MTSPPSPDLSAAQARAAVFTTVAIFLPVPLLDDLLIARAREHLVAAALRAHGRDLDPRRLQALWAGGGCLSGCLGLPLKLLLWPLKKLLRTVFFVLGLRAAALEVGRTLALGRTVDRRLRAGHLPGGPAPPPPAPDPAALEALRLRAALDRVYAGVDRLALAHAFGALLRAARATPRLLRDAARRVLRRGVDDEAAAVEALPPEERGAVAGAVGRVEAALEAPEVRAFLEGLDRRVDEALAAA